MVLGETLPSCMVNTQRLHSLVIERCQVSMGFEESTAAWVCVLSLVVRMVIGVALEL